MGNNSRSYQGFIFHNASTAIGNGTEFSIGTGSVIMNISVTGNATGFNLIFEGIANDTDDWTPIMCANLANLSLASSATANGKYQISLEGLIKIRCRISAIGANAITVRGTAVN